MNKTKKQIAHFLKSCQETANECTACAVQCRNMPEMDQCYNLCIYCASKCKEFISNFKNNSTVKIEALLECAVIGETCNKECLKCEFEYCCRCAKASLKWAKACRKMAA